MNADLPKITDAAFSLMSLMVGPARFNDNRISINPFTGGLTLGGDFVNGKLVDRLVADGYLEATPAQRPLFLDLTEQARKLTCLTCRGQGIVAAGEDGHEVQTCHRCCGRRIIKPGFDSYVAPKARKPRENRVAGVIRALDRRSNGGLSTAFKEMAKVAGDPMQVAPDLSPHRPGLYWLALDDGADYIGDEPMLVRIETAPDGFLMKFVDGRSYSPLDFAAMTDVRENTVHGFSMPVNLFGSFQSSIACEYRVTWLGECYPPIVPLNVKPESHRL